MSITQPASGTSVKSTSSGVVMQLQRPMNRS
jgi:hypothetical protein